MEDSKRTRFLTFFPRADKIIKEQLLLLDLKTQKFWMCVSFLIPYSFKTNSIESKRRETHISSINSTK